MSAGDVALLGLVAILAAYLLASLLRPERFR